MAIFVSLVAISAVPCCCVKAMSVSVFYYCLCGFFCCCRCFNASLCHLSPFLLSYVAVSRSCCLLEFYPQHGPHWKQRNDHRSESNLCNCVKKREKKKECISVAFLVVRERNFSHGDDTFIYPRLNRPNKIVGNQTKVKYYLLFLYISYCKTRLHGPSKAASLS